MRRSEIKQVNKKAWPETAGFFIAAGYKFVQQKAFICQS